MVGDLGGDGKRGRDVMVDWYAQYREYLEFCYLQVWIVMVGDISFRPLVPFKRVGKKDVRESIL